MLQQLHSNFISLVAANHGRLRECKFTENCIRSGNVTDVHIRRGNYFKLSRNLLGLILLGRFVLKLKSTKTNVNILKNG